MSAPQPKTASITNIAAYRKALPRILVIDEDYTVHALLEGLVNSAAVIISSMNASDGLAAIKQLIPDMVLLDNQTTGKLTSLNFIKKMQQLPGAIKSTPVLLMTSSNQPEDIMPGLIAGAIDYITKPINPAQLTESVLDRFERLNTKILIADSDKMVCDLLAFKFRSKGYKVQTAADGAQALKMIMHAPPNLVLLERTMPGFDGITLLQKMQALPQLADIPVIFLTAKRQEADILEGLNIGAADYIVKPFSASEVFARCLKVLSATTIHEYVTIDRMTLANNERAFVIQANIALKTMKRYVTGLAYGRPGVKPEIAIILVKLAIPSQTSNEFLGEKTLKAVAEYFQSRLRPADFLARLDEDEFGIIMNIAIDHIESVMKRLRDDLIALFAKAESPAPNLSFYYGAYHLQETDEQAEAIIAASKAACITEQSKQHAHTLSLQSA